LAIKKLAKILNKSKPNKHIKTISRLNLAKLIQKIPIEKRHQPVLKSKSLDKTAISKTKSKFISKNKQLILYRLKRNAEKDDLEFGTYTAHTFATIKKDYKTFDCSKKAKISKRINAFLSNNESQQSMNMSIQSKNDSIALSKANNSQIIYSHNKRRKINGLNNNHNKSNITYNERNSMIFVDGSIIASSPSHKIEANRKRSTKKEFRKKSMYNHSRKIRQALRHLKNENDPELKHLLQKSFRTISTAHTHRNQRDMLMYFI